MNLVDFVGFIFIFLGMIGLYFKRRLEKKQPIQEDENEELHTLLRTLHPQKVHHLPPQKVHEEEFDEFEEQIKREKEHMSGLQRKLFHAPGEEVYQKESVISNHLHDLLRKDLQEAVVLREVLGPPKGL